MIPSRYPFDTVCIPYGYKETETETQTKTEKETEKKEKDRDLRQKTQTAFPKRQRLLSAGGSL